MFYALSRSFNLFLSKHPNVFMSPRKEPHYFCDDFPGLLGCASLDEYLALFEEASADHVAVGEASVWYMYSKVAVKNILKFNPDAKFIIMLRNPVDLVYSMHAQSLNSVDENVKDFEKIR